MTKSIRNKLILYFLLLLVAATLTFEAFLWFFIRDYYYSFATSILENEAIYAAETYTASHSDMDLSEVILQDYTTFFDDSVGQVQILNLAGEVLLDSMNDDVTGSVLSTEDIETAKTGVTGSTIYRQEDYDTYFLSISHPLDNRDRQVGIIRYTASLERLESEIFRILGFFALFGLLVIVLSLVVIVAISNSIINPINKLTGIASRMARGQYGIRADESGEDEIAALGRTMNTLSDNIVEKEQIKNEFISSISHELRTPLTSIKGWAITLKGEVEDLASITNQGLDIIENESDRLSRMVEELLDFSSFVSGKMKLYKEIINVTELVKSIVIQLGPRAEGVSLHLDFRYEEENIMAEIDQNRIKQVIINVLDNSIKFTPAGGRIDVHLSQNEDRIQISVTDTGIGISPEEINRVTTRFYKGSHNQSHIGLGLSISEEIVRLHGGDFIIESVLGEETTVRIELPKETA